MPSEAGACQDIPWRFIPPPNRPQSPESVVNYRRGLAGLFCALKLAPKSGYVLRQLRSGRGAFLGLGASRYSGSGLSRRHDLKAMHDTIVLGDRIVEKKSIRMMATEVLLTAIHDSLALYGVARSPGSGRPLAVSREAAHSESRIVRVKGDMAGPFAIMEALWPSVRKTRRSGCCEGYVART